MSERFYEFADLECGASPLYRMLALTIAGNAEMLSVAARANHQPVPNLMLAAIHDLLLRSPSTELASFYPTLADVHCSSEHIGPALAAFVRDNRDELVETMRLRLVQTNEVRRALVLYLTVAWLVDREGPESIELVEIGCSAGLLLAFDHFAYQLAPDRIIGDRSSRLLIQIEARGDLPACNDIAGRVAGRTGIDLNTLDLDDPDDRRWLRALVWGDQPERLELLDRAIEVARRVPMTLLEGDGNDLLPGVLANLNPAHRAVIFHSHVLNQFPQDAKDRFEVALREASASRPIHRVSMEYSGDLPCVEVLTYRAGVLVGRQRLATYDAHGAWVEWSGGSSLYEGLPGVR